MTEELEFVDSLPGKALDEVTRQRAAQLMERPGEWAKWPSKMDGSGVKRALSKCGAGFEVKSRRGTIYIRWVTPAGESLPVVPTPAPKVGDSKPAPTPEPRTPTGITDAGPTTNRATNAGSALANGRVVALCGHSIAVFPGEDPEEAIDEHLDESPRCKAKAQRRTS